jgi:protein-S-isoprenylcysteine O-methyltransferase Ste14
MFVASLVVAVAVAFGLLDFAVASEERHLRRALKR